MCGGGLGVVVAAGWGEGWLARYSARLTLSLERVNMSREQCAVGGLVGIRGGGVVIAPLLREHI